MRSLGLSLIQGFSVLAVVLAVFVVSRWMGHSEADCRALTFVTLVVSNLCLILTNRSWSRTILTMFKEPNAALWWVVGGAVVFIGMVLCVPFLRDLFHFSRLHPTDLMICFVVGVASILWFEILKIVTARRRGVPA